jgi:predicted DNA-binding protein (MmcQ/YjbR family)
MHIEALRDYCISKAAVTEEFPFDEVTLVFKVAGKMFALVPTDKPDLRISLKCEPDRAISLREHYPAIIPAYHMNKQHWNALMIDQGLPDKLVYELIDLSYMLVVQSLPKKRREEAGLD